jgi:hypothetical protein
VSTQTTEELLGELIHVLAVACRDENERSRQQQVMAITAARRGAGMAARLSAADRLRPLAARLARSGNAGDYAGLDRILSAQRSLPDLRALVLLLASAADPERLEATGPALREAA